MSVHHCAWWRECRECSRAIRARLICAQFEGEMFRMREGL